MAERRARGGWDEGWSGHELAQLRRLASLSMIEKLDWLEQAQRLASRLSKPKGRGRKVRNDGSDG